MKIAFFATLLLFLAATPALAQQLWEIRELPAHIQNNNRGQILVQDFDDDDDVDLVAVTTEVRIARNFHPGQWNVWESGEYPFGEMYHGALADLDNDNDQDILFDGHPELGWLENLGGYQFSTVIIPGGTGDDIRTGDIEGDGDMDFIVCASDSMWIWTNDGSGNFMVTAFGPEFGATSISELADFNGDGFLDFVGTKAHQLKIYLTQSGPDIDLIIHVDDDERSFNSPLLVDLDVDGDVDLLVSERTYYMNGIYFYHVVVYENIDNQELNYRNIFYANQGETRPIATIDVNNDGYMDIVYGHLIVENNGNNFFLTAFPYSDDEIEFFDQLVVADMDNDGDDDILNRDIGWFVNPYISRRIEIGLDALQTNVPANGGFITYHGALLNNMANPRYLRVWSTVTFPGGNESTAWSMRRVFQPDQVYEAQQINQYVPPAAPPGTYTFTVHFGDPDQLDVIGDSFQFEKHE